MVVSASWETNVTDCEGKGWGTVVKSLSGGNSGLKSSLQTD